MKRFPAEFAELLTAKGRRILEGRDPKLRDALVRPDRFFVAIGGAIDRTAARAAHALLEQHMLATLTPLVAQVRALATRWYGRHLDRDWKKWTLAEAQAHFDAVGLTGDHWRLPAGDARY